MRADVMEHAGDGTVDPVIEAVRGVDVNRIAGMLARPRVDGAMGRRYASQLDEGLPFITHQMSTILATTSRTDRSILTS